MGRVRRKAVSSVIGVILMVAITVVLVAFAYTYITQFAPHEKKLKGAFYFEEEYAGGNIHYSGNAQFYERVNLKLSSVKVVVRNGNFSSSALLSELDPNGDSGIVGEWHFQEGSGTLTRDSSGNGNDGAIYGAAWTSGVIGNALSFDGSNDYVDCGNSKSLDTPDAITVETWAYIPPQIGTGDKRIVTKGSLEEPYWTLYRNQDSFRWRVRSGVSGLHDVFVDGTVSLNVWHHLVVTHVDKNVKMYVDGELKDELTGEDLDFGETVGTGKLLIGARFSSDAYAGAYFNGIVDEVRIYNKVLTAGQIKLNAGGIAIYFKDVNEDGLFSSEDTFKIRGAEPGAKVSLVYRGEVIATHTF
ncbi:MAG: LamG-like jellyroll fold domain-containing protein [Candidatus Thermoplasmatota archaeon]